ncbi:alkaline phosphatase [Brevundimonas sp. AAP58]|uniref:alkaline phosphatase D family protein n=1 Tax=Brevundimonas sp. AAP58 TaxID=1523422 RepID=UPI0006B8A171|nr:alkaline phosphatase D family protein [Brevundimonas sp. AAP58]KPF84534.1 alkaline phosphatase [Brevundimonas sp. AAP58]
MKIDRRDLLTGLGAGALAAPAVAAPQQVPTVAFLHGVASGDPHADSVVLWTRVTPGGSVSGAIPVTWRVLEGERVVTSGTAEASPDRDFTVKVIAGGLNAGVEYRYDFRVGDVVSPTGRVRTLPSGPTADVVLGVASCQLYPGGLFNAWEAMAAEPRLDAVIHLGDYIYEYGARENDYGGATGVQLSRLHQPPREILTLEDYRLRHAQYKSDPDLQAAHARAAFICVWDDHEVSNDAWMHGAENHQPETEGDFATKKATALRAYYEWMPIREPRAGLSLEHVNRSFEFGDLATLAMVETRLLNRAKPLDYETDMAVVDGRPDVEAFRRTLAAPDRDLLGEAQRDWLKGVLTASKSAGKPWQVLGNQVVMARVNGPDITRIASEAQIEGLISGLPEAVQPGIRQVIQLYRLGVPFSLDSWDGYPAGRERLYAAFAEAGVQPIVLAGDSHAYWVNELKDAAGARRAVEFGTSAISSPSVGDAVAPLPLGPLLSANNDEVVFCDQSAKGYLLLTLTPERAEAKLQSVSTILAKPFETRTVATFAVTRDANGITAPVRA